MDIQHDQTSGEFFVELEANARATLSYRKEGDELLDFYSVFVPTQGRGQGVAAKLVTHGFEYARDHGMRVRPTCPYVSGTFLKRYPEYQSLVD